MDTIPFILSALELGVGRLVPVCGYDGVKLCDRGYNHVLLCTKKLIVI